MVVETEFRHKSIPAQFRCIARGNGVQKVEEISEISESSPAVFNQLCSTCSISVSGLTSPELDTKSPKSNSDASIDSRNLQFFSKIRSGSFSDIGPRRCMEDEHICIDDLSTHPGLMFNFPAPSSFYGVFDGHGGPDAAAFVRRNALRLFFEDGEFPQTVQPDDVLVEEVENSVRNAFLSADSALADDCSISTSSGTTALTALVLGRLLLVANAGDCRAVLCRGGEAVDMSQDHRPVCASEKKRIEESGGFIDDGYLNGLLSVTRALGDWDMKLPKGSRSPLIAEPEFRQVELTEDDEFLIMGCDGIWDVMTSQDAVKVVRRGLRRHDDPEQCAKELVMEALRLNTFDNLTAIVVCFSGDKGGPVQNERPTRLRSCTLSAEALSTLKTLLD